MRYYFLFLFLIHKINAYTVAIAGAHGGLGRELVQQSIEKKLKTLALVRRPDEPIYFPCRDGWLSERTESINVIDDNLLDIQNINNIDSNYCVNALVISIGEKPFKKDDSSKLTKKLLNIWPSLEKVCLISAHGVGNDKDANIGITAMRNYYLKNVYDAKYQQEILVNQLPSEISTKIIRPRVLSYGAIPFNNIAVPRQKLAGEIIEWILT